MALLLVVFSSKASQSVPNLNTFTLRWVFAFVGLLSLGSAVCGALSFHLGRTVATVALGDECGVAGNTKSIEDVHKKLVAFEGECRTSEENAAFPVDQCPGFEEEFPPPAAYAMYLKLLEIEEGCAGFCHSASKRMFVPPGQGSKPTGGGKPEKCASHLGSHLEATSLLVGLPALLGGTILALFAAALTFYEEL